MSRTEIAQVPALRAYQTSAIDRIREASAQNRAVLCVSPTGSGKTTIAGEIVRRTVDRGKRVLWLAHRTELVGQAYDRLAEFGLDVGAVSASSDRPPQPHAPVQVASIQTLMARGQRPAADVVIWDECHHAVSDDWATLATDYARARLLGFTATPERSDGRGMGPTFTSIVCAASVRELIALGHLVPCEILRPPERLPPKKIAQRPVDAWLASARGRQTIVFAQWVAAAAELVEEFRAAGVAVDMIHAGSTDRSRILADYKSGKITVLVNVFVLTEGFDAPATSCVILARGCGTVGTYLQMVGRGLRPAEGKTECLLLDLQGVSHAHGKPEDDRTYSLDGRGISSGGDGSTCPTCGGPINFEGAGCPACATSDGVDTGPLSVTGDALVKYAAKRAESEEKRAETLARWIAVGRSKGWKQGAALAKFKAVYGCWPSDKIRSMAS